MQICLVILDFIVLYSAQTVASWYRFEYLRSPSTEDDLMATIIGVPITTAFLGVLLCVLWVVLIIVQKGYSFNTINGGMSWYRITLYSGMITLSFLAFFSYFARLEYSRILFILMIPIGIISLSVWHMIFRTFMRLLRRKFNFFEKTALLVGSERSIKSFKQKLQSSNEVGITPKAQETATISNIPQIADVAVHFDILMVLGSAVGDSDFVRQLRWAIEGKGVELVLDSNLTTVAGRRMHISALHNLPLLHIQVRQNFGWRFFIKRLFDIIFSVIILLILLVPFLIIMLIIKLDSKGPVFFRQSRIGRNGKEFGIYKFRSMRVGAEDELADLLAQRGQKVEALYKIEDDPRITKVGKVLRKTSLDEFPQFINTLVGSMSVVGPRPQIKEEVDTNSAEYNRRLVVKPGITGPWQVNGRSKLSLKQAEALDLDYIENWTLFGDLKIIAQTIREVIHPRGAF